jgi:hypothetical protein
MELLGANELRWAPKDSWRITRLRRTLGRISRYQAIQHLQRIAKSGLIDNANPEDERNFEGALSGSRGAKTVRRAYGTKSGSPRLDKFYMPHRLSGTRALISALLGISGNLLTFSRHLRRPNDVEVLPIARSASAYFQSMARPDSRSDPFYLFIGNRAATRIPKPCHQQRIDSP